MKQVPKPTTDDDLIQQFLNKGGAIKKGKTKPMPADLGLSNNQWGNKMTKEEKAQVKEQEEARRQAPKR
jgi:UDP-galactopyranose mutase